jgi:glycosyltransferase involved in cell wall biosynthesis
VVALFRSAMFNPSETFVAAQAAALRRYQPLIVGLRHKGNVPPDLAARLLLLDATQGMKLKLLGSGIGPAERLRRYHPALVHAHFGTDGLLALPIARRLRIPLVTTLHGYDVSRTRAALLASGRLSWIRYALLRSRLAMAGDLFIAVSDAVRRRAIGHGFSEARTVTHRIGVDLARFPPGKGGGATILHVGRLVEKKGTDLLLRAFASARSGIPQAELVIIGDGPRHGALERLAAALGLGASVRFLGAQPADVVAEWMGRSAVLAVPSVTAADGDAEGLPVVVFEAAASGLPVVGTDHAGIPEAVIDGMTGFVVPEGEVEPLAARLAELLADPGRAAAMGRNARALAEREFDLVRQTARLERLYDRVREPRCA